MSKKGVVTLVIVGVLICIFLSGFASASILDFFKGLFGFKATGKITDSPAPSLVYGDINQDGKFDMADLNSLTDIILLRVTSPQTGTQAFIAGDVNGDGKLDMVDLNLFTDRLLGRITQFPVENPDICPGGVCKPASEAPTAQTCSDNDGGKVYDKAGTVFASSKNYDDVCSSSTQLREWFCNSDNSVGSEYHDCTPYTCSAGACTTTAASVENCNLDSDYGANYEVKGTIKDASVAIEGTQLAAAINNALRKPLIISESGDGD